MITFLICGLAMKNGDPGDEFLDSGFSHDRFLLPATMLS